MEKDYRLIDEIEIFFTEFGEITSSTPVPSETIAKYQGILPEWLLGYWQRFGFFSVMDGVFWAVNPDEYQSVIAAWLPTELTENCYAIARTGWGDVIIWQPGYGVRYELNPLLGYIFENKRSVLVKSGYENKDVEGVFTERFVDNVTENGFFQKCVKAYGALQPDEMFTLVPPLFAGGDFKLKQIKKVNLFIQMDILAQLADPQIITVKDLFKQAFGNVPFPLE